MGKKVFVDLTHPFGAEIPRWPYFDKPLIDSKHTMAKGGVLTQSICCTMHTGTHCDAPRHVMEREFDGRRARYTHEMPVDAYTGEAVCLEVKIGRWGLIGPEHLEDACKRAGIRPEELEGMVVCLNTGMHRQFDDSKEYYHYSCGTGVEAGKWFVEHKVKCVAMDMQAQMCIRDRAGKRQALLCGFSRKYGRHGRPGVFLRTYPDDRGYGGGGRP